MPADAKAVTVNLTVTTPACRGFLTAWACGSPQPATSNLNFTSDQTVAVSAIVDVGDDGSICVFNNVATQVIVDVQGYFAAGSDYVDGLAQRAWRTRACPTRRRSTRAGVALPVRVAGNGGRAGGCGRCRGQRDDRRQHRRRIRARVPVRHAAGGPDRARQLHHPHGHAERSRSCNRRPTAPSASAPARRRASSSTRSATSRPGSPITVIAPTRLLDTRGGPKIPVLTDVSVPIVAGAGLPANAVAASVTVTAAAPSGIGFVVAYPCGAASATSTLNVVPNRATTNSAIIAPGADGRICVKANVDDPRAGRRLGLDRRRLHRPHPVAGLRQPHPLTAGSRPFGIDPAVSDPTARSAGGLTAGWCPFGIDRAVSAAG